MKKFILSIAVTITGACGPNGGSDLAVADKAQPIRNGFLVDMALTPAPEGKCLEGGVTQNYYYDLNSNGELDPGEDTGLVSAVDCYSGVIAKTNPCGKTDGVNCEIPTKSNQPILKDCKDATNEQKLTAASILSFNGKKDVPLESACAQLVELSKTVTDTDVYLHRSNNLSFDDYSILTIMTNINGLAIDGMGSAQKEIRNISSLKILPYRILGELRLTDLDFTDISFFDFLPQKGAKNVAIYNSNIVGFSKLSSWSYISKSPIVEIINSTAIRTAGPRF